MSVKPLIQLSRNNFTKQDTILRTPCKEVSDFDDDFQQMVDNLLDTFYHHRIAVGLAASQIGISACVTIVNINKDDPESTLVIVNPVILSATGKKDRKKESCLSLPHYQGEVERRYKIKISYQDRYGDFHELKASGFFARVLFHEIDHLDGVLYVDRMDNLSNLEPVDFFRESPNGEEYIN